jgi:hypothetical protein
MQTLHCEYRKHTITANIVTHPGSPMPFSGGCLITDPEGLVSKRKPLPLDKSHFTDLEKAQHASLAHGRWLVDQQLGT